MRSLIFILLSSTLVSSYEPGSDILFEVNNQTDSTVNISFWGNTKQDSVLISIPKKHKQIIYHQHILGYANNFNYNISLQGLKVFVGTKELSKSYTNYKNWDHSQTTKNLGWYTLTINH